MRYRLGLCSGLLLSLSGVVSCSSNVHHNDLAYGYGTYWDIHLYEGGQSDCDEIATFVSTSSRLFDVSEFASKTEGLNALNQSNDFVTLDSMVLEALGKAVDYEKETGGAFNYHLGELTDLWLSCLEGGKTLDEVSRDEALTRAKATSVEISKGKARRVGEGKIDLNALAKGYCCLKIKEMLDEKGFTKYFINAGTSSLLVGENSSSDGTVKVNLDDAPGRYFKAKHSAVSCSSSSRQAYEIGGKTYSHIVSPFTGDAVASYQAVYLQGSDACALDAYSTAAMVSGLEFGKALEEKGIQIAYVQNGEVSYETSAFLA